MEDVVEDVEGAVEELEKGKGAVEELEKVEGAVEVGGAVEELEEVEGAVEELEKAKPWKMFEMKEKTSRLTQERGKDRIVKR